MGKVIGHLVHHLAAPHRSGVTVCGHDTASRRIVYVIHSTESVTCTKCRRRKTRA